MAYELGTVNNSIELLRTLADSRDPLGLSELSRFLNLSKPSTQRLLKSLEKAHFVRKHAQTKKYTLGLGLWELGWNAVRRLGLREVAHPYLERLAQKTQETALLAVLNGFQIIYVDIVHSPQPVQLISSIGGSASLHCVATGRVLLAYQSDDFVHAVLRNGLPPLTKYTITNPKELLRRLDRIRTRGWEMNYQERRLGGIALAAPVWDHNLDKPVVAIGISGPIARFPHRVIKPYATLVTEVARELSVDLGYLPDHAVSLRDLADKRFARSGNRVMT